MTACSIHDPVIITGDWSLISTNTAYFTGSDFPRSAFVQSVVSNLTVTDENGHTIGIDSDLKSTNLVAYLNRLTIGITNTNDLMVNYLGNVTISSAVTWNNGGFIVDAINGITVNAITASKFVMAHTTDSDLYVNGPLTANGDNASVQLSGANINVVGAILASDGLTPFLGTTSIIAQGDVNFNSNTVTAAYGLIAAENIYSDSTITNGNILKVSGNFNVNCSTVTGSIGTTLSDGVKLYSANTSLQVNADPSTAYVVMISPCNIYLNTSITAQNFITIAGRNIISGSTNTNAITVDGQVSVNTTSDGGFVLLAAGRDITHYDINARNNSNVSTVGNGGIILIHAGSNYSADNITATTNASNTGFTGGIIVQHAGYVISQNTSTAAATSDSNNAGAIIIQSGQNIHADTNLNVTSLGSGKSGIITAQTPKRFLFSNLSANSSGSGFGGIVNLHTIQNVKGTGSINVSSSDGLGGGCFIDAQDDVNVLGQILVNSSGNNNPGGSTVVYSGDNINVLNSTSVNANSSSYIGGTIKLCAKGIVRATGLTSTGTPSGSIKLLSGENIFSNVSGTINPFVLTASCTDFTIQTTSPYAPNQYQYKVSGSDWVVFANSAIGGTETISASGISKVTVRNTENQCLIQSVCLTCPDPNILLIDPALVKYITNSTCIEKIIGCVF